MRPVLPIALFLAACGGSAAAPQSPEPAPAEAAGSAPAGAAPASAESRKAALDALLREQWEYRLAHEPVFATIVGDTRYNDRWGDLSPEAIAADLAWQRSFLEKLRAVDTTGLSEQDVLNQRLMVRDIERTLRDARFEDWLMPFDQLDGLQIQLPQIVSVLRLATVKDYEDYIKRLDALPTVLEQATQLARQGMAKGLMPPRFLLEKAAAQTDGLGKGKPEDSPFAQPVAKFPDAIPAADQQRLRAAVLRSIQTKVLPAYGQLATFLRTEYAPKGSSEVGIWALPDGAERYAAAARFFTTTDMTPDQIHDLGVSEVARIEAESLAIARKLGFKDLASFQASIRKNKKLHASSRQQILDAYQAHTDAMYAELPKLFGRLPKGKMQIQQTEAYREKEAPGAQYVPGTPDGSRAGMVRVNTADPTKRTLIGVETTAYHEGVPGHHLQVALALEVPGLAPFRQFSYYGAFIEGWALYAERIAREIGYYKDPYSEYGHLQAEMLRAIRLVVDTGLHHKKWTREQVIAYFRAHSALDEPTIQNETDRYIVAGGQALSYKVGQITIVRLRQKAKDALGDRFDLRAFHDEILGGGALPLDVLEERVDAWVARQKAA